MVSIKEIQKKYQPKVSKPKKVGTRESLAIPKPKKSRLLLRWSPTSRLFNQEGKIVDSSESKNKSDCYNGDNACTSNILEPKIKRFPNSTSLLDRNDHVAAILGFGDLQWGNILITRVYFIEGLGHNLFSVGQFYDSDLEVAFRRNACFVRNLEGVDLLKGDRNLKLLINFVWKFLGTVRFGNDHVAAILGFGDLQWGNILITRVYFVEGLGHNLFSVGQFCDSDLEVAFRRNACFVRNLEGVDLLKGDRSTNLYTINLHVMASASPICLMARASSTKS
nr:integrase, catalytic region, zinc finger, CCHC-type, peptidase aspartic, catalytic [Tanacetum cinerariifolium]